MNEREETNIKIVRQIEKDKMNRSKCIFYFTLSLTKSQETVFRKELMELINDINLVNENYE